MQALNQFHNGYVQFFVSFGLIGAVLMAALLIALVRSALGQRAGAYPLSPYSPLASRY